MKKIKYLLLLFICTIFIPKVNALELELKDEFNIGLYTNGVRNYELYKIEDSFYGYCNGLGLFFRIDKNGEIIYTKEIYRKIITKEKIYSVNIDATYNKSSNNYSFDLELTEYDIKTGESVNTNTFEKIYSDSYDFVNYLYYNEHGIVVKTLNGHIILIDSDFTKYRFVDNSYLYNNYEMPINDELILGDEYYDFIDYLIENKKTSSDEFIIDYAIKYNNNYFTIISKPGGIYSLVYTNKNLEEEINILPINNSFRQLEVKNFYMFVEGKELYLFTSAGYMGCLSSSTIDITDGCNRSGDIILQKYTSLFDIETKTDGNGDVKSTRKNAESGEEIEFEIIPKEGYVLGVVKVTDANGDIVEFTDYKFTMPGSNVLIEATFEKKTSGIITNPETKDIAIISTGMILIAGFILMAINYKKLNFLK